MSCQFICGQQILNKQFEGFGNAAFSLQLIDLFVKLLHKFKSLLKFLVKI